MPTYVYETQDDGSESRTYEIRQSIHDAPLTRHPETGERIRRLISGGVGFLKVRSGGLIHLAITPTVALAAMSSFAVLQKSCPRCGFCESDFKKTLRLGCPHCYEVFGPELSTFLPKMHSGCTHVGKIPSSFSSVSGRLKQELLEVENLLAHGVGEADELLDRWTKLSLQIEAGLKPINPIHENS